MTAPERSRRGAPPRSVVGIFVLMVVAALLMVFLAAGVQEDIDDTHLVGATTTIDVGLARAVIVLLWALAAAQPVAGVPLLLRLPWARPVAIGVELLAIAVMLLGIAVPMPVVYLIFFAILPAAAARLLFTREVAEWFGR